MVLVEIEFFGPQGEFWLKLAEFSLKLANLAYLAGSRQHHCGRKYIQKYVADGQTVSDGNVFQDSNFSFLVEISTVEVSGGNTFHRQI